MAEKKINGRIFRVGQTLATETLILKARLLKVLGPAGERLGDVFAGLGTNASEDAKAKANAAAIGALASIFAESDPRAVAMLVKDVVEIAQIRRPSGDYGPVDLDGDFTEHKGDILPVAVWVLREEFGPFFSGLQENGGLAGLAKG